MDVSDLYKLPAGSLLHIKVFINRQLEFVMVSATYSHTELCYDDDGIRLIYGYVGDSKELVELMEFDDGWWSDVLYPQVNWSCPVRICSHVPTTCPPKVVYRSFSQDGDSP